MSKTLLIDGDILAYLASCSVSTAVDWDNDGDISELASTADAQHRVSELIDRWQKESRCGEVVICLSDPSRRYFRHDLFPSYKGHRSQGRVPPMLMPIKDMLRSEGAVSYPTLEADDVLGILATEDTVICTLDKDLLQIPGWNYNPKKNTLRWVEEVEAQAFFYRQVLMGDGCDGYPGCPRIGPVKSDFIVSARITPRTASEPAKLDEVGLWGDIVQLFSVQGLDEDHAITQARVARILQKNDWDAEKQEVKLWNPPC